MTIRTAIVGYGKIAEDQHVPALQQDPAFELVAVVSRRRMGPPGVPAYASIDELRSDGLAVDAVALCNTPEDRPAAAFAAIDAGWHVLMEKPPAASQGAAEAIVARAQEAGVTLFAAWHSRFAAAVEPARRWLAGRQVQEMAIDWQEDVRKWHPGQAWIWEPGGFGVFDPGINGLSVATAVLPFDLFLSDAVLHVPVNRRMPIAAELVFSAPGVDGGARATFDWRRTDGERWTVRIAADGHVLELLDGGARLTVDGVFQPVPPGGEYPGVYRRFAELVCGGRSDADLRPLTLVTDAFLLGARRSVEAFHD